MGLVWKKGGVTRETYGEEHEAVPGEGQQRDGVGHEAEADDREDELEDADRDESARVARDVLPARRSFGRHCHDGRPVRVSQQPGW